MAAAKKIIRVYTDDHPFLKQLGLSDTFKTVVMSGATTAAQMEQEVRRALSKGLTEAQAETLADATATFEVMLQPNGKTAADKYTSFQPTDRPLEALAQLEKEDKGTDAKFWFIAPPHREERRGFRGLIKEKIGRRGTIEAVHKTRRAAFGVPLSRQAMGGCVPVVLSNCITAVLTHGVKSEGVFRLSANVSELEAVKAQHDAGESPQITDEHLAAALLKMWLRELPEPILSFSRHPVLIALAPLETSSERFSLALALLLGSLPPPNRLCLHALLKMVAQVASFSEINKMTPSNLARCLGPNLSRPPHEEADKQLSESDALSRVLGGVFERAEHFAAICLEPPHDLLDGYDAIFATAAAVNFEPLGDGSAVSSFTLLPPHAFLFRRSSPADGGTRAQYELLLSDIPGHLSDESEARLIVDLSRAPADADLPRISPRPGYIPPLSSPSSSSSSSSSSVPTPTHEQPSDPSSPLPAAMPPQRPVRSPRSSSSFSPPSLPSLPPPLTAPPLCFSTSPAAHSAPYGIHQSQSANAELTKSPDSHATSQPAPEPAPAYRPLVHAPRWKSVSSDADLLVRIAQLEATNQRLHSVLRQVISRALPDQAAELLQELDQEWEEQQSLKD